ncbi:MAG: hypothetical protein AUK43_13960 [Oscillatoriales cyanobacterium CG2_30_40_61]|nr:MAG: hypothetical protein AUK43_13960 [Oscillatoriales cyanobacterium CG2_30_40_61]
MSKFKLFDAVHLTETIPLTDGGVASIGTVGTIVEVLKAGEAYIVELFGNWVKYDHEGNFIPAKSEELEAFMETIGVEIVNPEQIILTASADQLLSAREQLTLVLDDLSEDLILEVRDFAEFLQQKQLSRLG